MQSGLPKQDKTYYKKLKTYTNYAFGGPMAPKRPRIKNRYETIVKVYVAHTLHTCSGHKRFSSSISEKTIVSRDRVQRIQLSVHMFDFPEGFTTDFRIIK